MLLVAPCSVDGLVVIVGDPLLVMAVSLISGMVCAPVLVTVVFPPAVTVVSLFPWIGPSGFHDVSPLSCSLVLVILVASE